MTIYKRNFDENKRTYFSIKAQKVFIKYMKKTTEVGNMKNKSDSELIKAQKVFIKYMKITEKVGNIKNKSDSELQKKAKTKTSKKKKKTHTHTHTKEGFQCSYALIILTDSIYRKDEKYYPIVFLEKYYFIEGINFA